MANFGTGGLGMLGKFIQGYSQGKIMKEGKQERLADKKIQQQKMETEKKLLDIKLLNEQFKVDFLKQLGLMEQGAGEASKSTVKNEPTPLSENFGGSGKMDEDLTGNMAIQQLVSMNPMVADMLGFGSAQGRAETQSYHDKMYGLARQRESRQASEMVPFTAQTPEGGEITGFRPKYGEQTPYVSKQPQIEMKKREDKNTGQTYEVPINPRTNEEVGQRQVVAPLKGESAEASARIALANNGMKHLDTLDSMFIMPDGSINRKLIFESNAPFGGMGEGRTAYATFLDALDARARAATGAAMPDSEIKNYTRMYWPSPLDSDATVKDKLGRLRGFMTDYLKTLDPSGKIRNRLKETDPLGLGL